MCSTLNVEVGSRCVHRGYISTEMLEAKAPAGPGPPLNLTTSHSSKTSIRFFHVDAAQISGCERTRELEAKKTDCLVDVC
jgi:hypothetical protein